MSALEVFQIRPLTEVDLDFVMDNAGGVRAHQDADRRSHVGADYKLGGTLIELKGLDEEGFAKVSRQQKLAGLFQEYKPERPVVVLDRHRLTPKDQARFDRIIEGPIKTAIAKANRQLKQSRAEQSDATCSVLMAINNGYTTLNHEAFKALVSHRVRQDTQEIDVVIAAGVYYHSDGFDSYFLWPMDYIPINMGRRFVEFERLRTGWNALANHFMTQLLLGELGPGLTKGPVADTQFVVDGITYIRPAPVIGAVSSFYVHGRPRKSNSGFTSCPPVGRTFPAVSYSEWFSFKKLVADPSDVFGSYENWKQVEAQGQAEEDKICPFVTVPITAHDWTSWRSKRGEIGSLFQFANEQFNQQVHELIARARELESAKIVPVRYILAVTNVIGQDRANDFSDIIIVHELPDGKTLSREILKNARIIHEHAVALAASYALRERVDVVMWSKDLKYAWV